MSNLELEKDELEKRIQGEELFVADIYAQLCAACVRMAPIMEELANDYASQAVTFGKMDLAKDPAIASKYRILSIPTIIFFYKGKELDRATGYTSKKNLKKKIDDLLKKV